MKIWKFWKWLLFGHVLRLNFCKDTKVEAPPPAETSQEVLEDSALQPLFFGVDHTTGGT